VKENADNVSAEKKHMIDVVHLSKHFGDLVVLDDISDTVYEGEKVCIIGPSGSGKSTYLRCLNVLEDPTSGKVIFDGEDLCDLKVDINLHRQKMGMVFQQFNLFNNMTVKKNITMAPVHIGKKKIRTVKRKNFFTRIANVFRREKSRFRFSSRSGTYRGSVARSRADSCVWGGKRTGKPGYYYAADTKIVKSRSARAAFAVVISIE